ncbi:phosphoribosylglycinamide formyltransferase [Methanosalsum natronophilum]|uniref:phosphoribosylglycinamide formyltransferase n=1 Tax=Methanosalsum natronophilum TaxID=768733 RepID=UPI0021683869|nr:phosphoribosylglycinamide formyltransferase [Methanosalsum natronophilum]MCS3924348.1 phosphoribosylglycinamide formyltransferase-1 [Methanosalsum natronophilum]
MIFNIAVLASGRGSNLQSIIDNIENGYIPNASVKLVVSDVNKAYALQRAKKHSIESLYLNPLEFKSKKEYEKLLIENLQKRGIDLVLLAGYMRLLGNSFILQYKNKIMNIHPSLLPSFKGLDAQKQALEYGVKVSGCTVHFVDEGMDSGPIILQEAVKVCENDTVASLSERILEKEHIIYPEAVKLFVEGKLKVEGRIVVND